MVMELNVPGLPTGAYDVELVGVEELDAPEEHPDWGASAEITVMVVGGVYDGRVESDRMGKRLGKKSRFGKLLRGILGRELQVGEKIKLEEYFGRRYHLTAEVEDGRSKFIQVIQKEAD